MNPIPPSALSAALRFTPRSASFVVISLGCLGLAGWTLELENFKTVFPGSPAMVPNTAVAVVLAGLSLWLVQSQSCGERTRRLGQACALAVTLIGAVTLCEYLFKWQAGIDQFLFRESLNKLSTPLPGRPSFLTALKIGRAHV